MVASVSEQCRACVTTLKTTISSLSDSNKQTGPVRVDQVNDALEKFSLWMGNIGALHGPTSSMSLESRLHEAHDVLAHILELLADLNEVGQELLSIVSGERQGEIATGSHEDGDDEDQNEETELLEEINACITRLFRVSSLIRQAAPTDLFAKALSRNRYQFNDQFDIAHVGEKYPKLATPEFAWLQKRLGRAITQRRHYLSYIQDHREKLEGMLSVEEVPEPQAPELNPLPTMKRLPDSASQPSTFFTKASTLLPGHITPQMLVVEEESDPENDARSYTTISRSVDGDFDSSATVRIPKLDQLRAGPKNEVECPFCFRMKKFKNERVWRRHVFSDLRPYLCTYPDCDAPYFGDINEWFRHEMQNHRVSYTCRLCHHKTFQLKERYLGHIQKHHPDMLEEGEQQPLFDIARKPLDHIPASDCPCCSDWVDRLKERIATVDNPSGMTAQIVSVVPAVFKRHLASHMEQLALFAVPLSADNEDADSNAAIEDNADALLGDLDRSTLTFPSSRPSTATSKKEYRPTDWRQDDSKKTRDKQERRERSGKYSYVEEDLSGGGEEPREPPHYRADIRAKSSHGSDLSDLEPFDERHIEAERFAASQPDLVTFSRLTFDPRGVKGQNIRHDIVRGEEEYLESLNIFCTFYRDLLLSAQPPVIPLNELDYFIEDVFDIVDAVKRVGEDHLLAPMKYRQHEQGPFLVGFSDIFRSWIRRVNRAYIQYAGSWPYAIFRVQQEEARNVLFRAFLKEAKSQSPSRQSNWDIYEFLKAPSSRLHSYLAVLEAVSEKSTQENEGRKYLQIAIEEFEVLTKQCRYHEAGAAQQVEDKWYHHSDGTIDASSAGLNPLPPPFWLNDALVSLRERYPQDKFEASMVYKPPQSHKYQFAQYVPRIRCLDCPGKMYTPGPGHGVEDFEIHLRNRLHRTKVEERITDEEVFSLGEVGKLNLTREEKIWYSHLFTLADTERLGLVTGERAVKFFEVTKVPPAVLGEIWQIVDSENRGLLTSFRLCQFLRLVGHYQAGRDPALEISFMPAPLPKFEGIAFPSAMHSGKEGDSENDEILTSEEQDNDSAEVWRVFETDPELIDPLDGEKDKAVHANDIPQQTEVYEQDERNQATSPTIADPISESDRSPRASEDHVGHPEDDVHSHSTTTSHTKLNSGDKQKLWGPLPSVQQEGPVPFCPQYASFTIKKKSNDPPGSQQSWDSVVIRTNNASTDELLAEVKRHNKKNEEEGTTVQERLESIGSHPARRSVDNLIEQENVKLRQAGLNHEWKVAMVGTGYTDQFGSPLDLEWVRVILKTRLKPHLRARNETPYSDNITGVGKEDTQGLMLTPGPLQSGLGPTSAIHSSIDKNSRTLDEESEEDLYKSMERVLMELKSSPQSHSFGQCVKKSEAPDYYAIIKEPMDLNTIEKLLQRRSYSSKTEFENDLMLIWSNCLKYNTDPANPLRKEALYMRKETESLLPLIPDLVVRNNAAVEVAAHGERQEATSRGIKRSLNFRPPVEVLGQDSIPYPAFLLLSKEDIRAKFYDLEWVERKRIIQGLQADESGQPSQWRRCSANAVMNRNRYANVEPYDKNRVKLKVPEGYSDYINASLIELTPTKSRTTMKFIATQGPKQETVSHFWRMVWDETESPTVIIMLTRTHETGREKCVPYYPVGNDSELQINGDDEFGDGVKHILRLTYAYKSEGIQSDIREMMMAADIPVGKAVTNVVRIEAAEIRHYQFYGWLDFAVPEGESRQALIDLVLLCQNQHGTNLQIVHCSAGVGRTGTFIALSWLLRELREGALDHVPEDKDPIFEVVDKLRQQRMMMVQGEAQYTLLYEILREQWRKRWEQQRGGGSGEEIYLLRTGMTGGSAGSSDVKETLESMS